MMLRLTVPILLLAAPVLHADPLSEADREALIEKLDNLRDTAQKTAMSRIGSAAQAFKAGMASDDAAVALYLKCVEKVDFEDRNRSSQDFREWKRRQEDRLKDPGTRRGLRHQLRWLVLSLEAAESGGDYEKVAPKAAEALDAIFGNPDQFDGDVGPLREPVTGTVFARAYNLGGAKVENWPLSPLEVAGVFNQVILPGLRADRKFDSMREQWQKRIRYEGILLESMSGKEKGKGKAAERSPEHEKFLIETVPNLEWQMEVDLFKSGDQKRAAVNMLAQIESNLGHPKVRDWGTQFRDLVAPAEAEDPKAIETAGPVD